MRRGWTLVIGMILSLPFALAQINDDPRQHWAYEAFEQLQRLGILEGYPDGSLRPNRPLTRAEFAQAVARAYRVIDERLRNLQRRLDTFRPPTEPAPLPTDEALTRRVRQLQADVQELQKLNEAVQALQRLAQAVQTDIDQMGIQIGTLKEELQMLQQRFETLTARFSWQGDLTFGGYSTHSFDKRSAFTYNGNPIDASGRFLQSNAMVHELALTIQGRANENVLGRATFIISNYLPYLGSPTRNADAFHAAPSVFRQGNTDIAVWEAYIQTALPLFGRRFDITLGRLPLRFTPYTLQRIDPDYYLDFPRYQDGAFRVDGALFGTSGDRYRLHLFLASVHQRRSANANASQIFFANHNASVSAPADQLFGLRVEYDAVRGEENFVTVGLTAFAAGVGRGRTFRHLNNPTRPADRVDVVGFDVRGTWSNIRFGLEYAQSIVYHDEGRTVSRNNVATDIYAEYDFSERLGGRLGYREVQPFFIAPGNWGRIGYLYNPSDIKGSYFTVRYKVSNRLQASLTGDFYEGSGKVLLPQRGYQNRDKLNRYLLEASYQLHPRWHLQVAYENVAWRIRSFVFAPNQGNPTWNYLTLQLSYDLGENASLSLLYQIIDANGKGVPELSGGPGATGNRAGVAATTLGVRF
ncbi:S-layer protein SlpA [bacterium HR15]|nr:S-layer protein SlpA [bacterium HR15]